MAYERVILELQIGGRRWLIADTAGELTDDGASKPVQPGLPSEIPDAALDFLSAAEPLSILVEQLRLPGLGALSLDLPLTATLAALPTSTSTWQQRRPLLTLTANTWTRAPGEYLTADLTADTTPEDLATWPPPSATMSPATWPLGVGSTTRASDGSAYPVVFGAPGVYTSSDGTSLTARASPAYSIDPSSAGNRILVVASDPVQATTVTVVDPSDGTTATGTISTSTDGLGRRVAVATVPAAHTILPLTDQTYRVIWDAGAGLYSETSRTATWTATEACLYFLRRSGVRIDRPRWRGLADDLDGFILAGATEKAVQPWSYLLDAVLPLLPISLILGPDGWRPVLFRHSWPAAHARAHLQVRPGELYEATQRETTGQLTPTIRLSWAYDADADAFRETLSCVGDPAERGTGVQTSAYTLAAYSRWLATQASNTNALQEPPAYTWEADNIYDRATAARVVSWWTVARALPATILTYPASPNLLDLDLGDPVLLTDGTQGLSRAPALVEGFPLARRSSPTIRLRLLPSPLLPSYL